MYSELYVISGFCGVELLRNLCDRNSHRVCVCCSGLYCPHVETPEHGPNLSSLPEGEFVYLRSGQKAFKNCVVPCSFAGGSPLDTCLLGGNFRCLHGIKVFQLCVILSVAANKWRGWAWPFSCGLLISVLADSQQKHRRSGMAAINNLLRCRCAAVRIRAIVQDLRHWKHNYPSLRATIKAASPALRALLRRLHHLHVTIAATHSERRATTGGLVHVCSVSAACVRVWRKVGVINATH